MSTTILSDIKKVLPAAIVNRMSGVADCTLLEGGSTGIYIDEIPGLLRASLFAVEVGACETLPIGYESHHLRSAEWAKIRQATREVLTDWHRWCSHDPKPVNWRGQVKATERVLAWLDSLDVPTPDPEEVAA